MNKAYEKLGKLAYSHTKQDHMATFSGNTDFFEIVSKVENFKEEIKLKEDEIEKIKLEYGIDDNEIKTDNDQNHFNLDSNEKVENQTN